MTSANPPRIRSFFIAPANRPDLVMKFPRFLGDLSILDLEDGTPPFEKERARSGLPELTAAVRGEGLTGLLGVRVNEPWSAGYIDDIEVAARLPIDILVVPKVEAPEELFPAVHAIRRSQRGNPRVPTILAGIETVRGVANADRIFGAYPEISCTYFGAEDFLADIGGLRTRNSAEVQHARAHVLLQAKRFGLTAVDQPIADVRDEALFREDARAARQMGYDGKVCLLPKQVEIAHEIFSPSPEEVSHARRLIAAYDEATGTGIGTIEFEGKMIDGPLVKRAQRVLAQAGI